MTAVERFIAGEDRLSAVLKAAPFFDAPAALASWMNQTARSVEDERAAAAPPCVFEPPARLRDAVLQEAWALERAQTPRRQALRAALAREADIGKILGAPVAPATEAWLRDIWARQEKSPRAPAPPSPPARRRSWWKPGLAFGTGLGVALVAVLAVRHLGNVPEMPPPLAAADAPLIVTTPDTDDWMPPPLSLPAPDESLRAAKPTAPARAASTEAAESETEMSALRQPASAPPADRAQMARAAPEPAPSAAPEPAPEPAPAPADEPLPPQREDDLAAADKMPPLLAAADAPPIVMTPDVDDWMPPSPSLPAPDESPRAAKPAAPARAASTEAAESETEMPPLRQAASAPLADRAQMARAAPAPAPALAPVLAPAPADEPLPLQREDDLAAADIWPLGAAQWKQLAASFRHAPIPHADAPSPSGESAPQQPWRLLVSTPEAPEALALAAFLRQSLPPGAELLIHADPAIPAGFARLAPPRQP